MKLAEVGRRYPRADGTGAMCTVTKVRPVRGFGLCVEAEVESSNSKDTRVHKYDGRLADFARQWITGHTGIEASSG